MEQIHYKKKYGQNFLKDKSILQRIVDSANVTKDDLIIEIGPGSGNLTKYLQKFDCNIIAFEIDKSLKDRLSILENDKTNIVYQDILEVNLKEVIDDFEYQNLFIIANIPYYITTPIVMKIINSNINEKAIILMVQKEVAERFTASPKTKDYGYITVFLQSYYNIKKLFDVNKNCFFPVPNVDSSIVKLIPNKSNITNPDKFNSLISSAFKYKRKTLKNNLNNYNLELIEKILVTNGYSLSNRAEEIPLDVFINISNEL